MAVARHCALSAAILGGQAGYRSVGGPWWAEFALAGPTWRREQEADMSRPRQGRPDGVCLVVSSVVRGTGYR
jgi:hypothetical protein